MSERAMTNTELAQTGINFDDYAFAEEAGTAKGKLTAKMWGRKRNLVSYYDMEDGRKLKFSTWYNQDYLGIDKIPVGTSVMIVMSEGKNYIQMSKIYEV